MRVEYLWRLEEIRGIIDQVFPVTEIWFDGGRPIFAVHLVGDTKARFLALKERLESLGYLPLLRHRDGMTVIALMPRPPRGRWRWQVNLLLFLGTLLTTFFAGYFNFREDALAGYLPSAAIGGLTFSLSLMLILVCHEMGHKVISIWRGIDASLPYFIPVPPLPGGLSIGTLGAVIVTRTPAPNRDALIDLGASGPIAGFLVTIPILAIGISRSVVLTQPVPGPTLPTPLLIDLMLRWILNPPENAVVLVHPMVFAGWIGLLVTALNLLPASMLDGGHVARSLLGSRAHMIVSYGAVALAILLGYWPMGLLILFMIRRGHPGPLDDISGVSPLRRVVALALVAIFILSAVPLIPIRMF